MKLYYETKTNELMHYGVPGMKWGVRRAVRGHAGPGNYLTKKRRLAGDKRDLEYLNKGGHLSVGLTKKRQTAYDARDKAVLEKRIAKTQKKDSEPSVKDSIKTLVKEGYKIYDKKLEIQQRKNDRQYKIDRFDTIVKPDNPRNKFRKLRELDKNHKRDIINNNYKKAVNKSKIDPKYKNSAEYKKVMKDYGKQQVLDILKDITTPKKPDNPYKRKLPKHRKDF